MADLVLGVAKSLVDVTVSRAESAIEEEAQLRKSTRRNLMFIRGEFQMMQCYLRSMSRDKVKNNEVVSTWVAQLHELAYNVEDGIEFVVHLDLLKSDWWCRVIPSCMAPARPLDEAADMMEELKTRVQDVRQRISHYSLLISNSADEKQRSASHVRRNEDLTALRNLIDRNTPNLEVISLWVPRGGDLENTISTFRKAYNNPRYCGKFKCRVWVKVEESVNTDEFLGTLLEQLKVEETVIRLRKEILAIIQMKETQAPAAQHSQTQTLEAKQNRLREVMEAHKYLVVLEDVPDNLNVWRTIRKYFPDNRKGSRIIVITRELNIATSCTGSPYVRRFWADFSLCVLHKQGPLVGRTSEIKTLSNYLEGHEAKGRREKDVESLLISIWGLAGTGKSALVREVCDKLQYGSLFKNKVWVDVTHPFDLMAIYKSLYVQFKSQSPHNVPDEDIVQECHLILNDTPCLLVFDNLQSKEDWDMIDDIMPYTASGSINIVITNDESIALHCANNRENFVLNVKALEARSAFDLFKCEVQGDEFLGGNVENDKVLRQLISMCGGLPKVLVAISDYLAQEKQWSRIGKHLSDNLIVNLERRPEFTCLQGLFSSIHHYFCSCPDYLKPCIFYLSVFRRLQTIRRRRLVMRWIAEGYCKDKASDTTDNSGGEEIFASIAGLSMIQPLESTIDTGMRMKLCQVNAFLHEYIIRRQKGENFTFPKEVFSLEGCCRQSTGRTHYNETGSHLVIDERWKLDSFVFETIDFSRLRSLTVYGEWKSYFISESMKVLRVLDLEDAEGVKNKDLEIMLKLLPRLKFLSLRGCSEISYLPASVGDLRQLQTLDVRYTSVVAIPASITKLEGLQYLRGGNRRNETAPPAGSVTFKLSQMQRSLQLVGVNVESRVGKLTTLHTIGVVNVGGAGGKGILNELMKLHQLRKFGVSGICRENRNKFFSAISDHSHLRSLSVWLKEKNEDALYDMPREAKPPKELQSLKLYGPVNKLPTWIKQLNNIRKLNLEMDILSPDDIKVLGELKELCILRLILKPKYDEILHFCASTDRPYKKLKVLKISSRSGLRLTTGRREREESGGPTSAVWRTNFSAAKALQNLELLEVRSDCTGSQLEFEGLGDLYNLKEIRITICSQLEALRKHLEDQFTDPPYKTPVFKLEKVNAPAGHQSEDSNVMGNIIIFLHELSETTGTVEATGGKEQAHGSPGRNDQPIQTQQITIGGNSQA